MKFRLNTWYWGNYCLKGSALYKQIKDDSRLELYCDDLHGWHNSDEYKNGQKEPYKC